MQAIPKDNSKIESISVMRVMAMFMIILFHSFYFYADVTWILGGTTVWIWDKVDTYLDIIDLPMFVFISGFLFGHLFYFKGKYRDRKRFFIGKAKRLLLPYFLWGLLQVIFMSSLFGWQSLITGCGHLWFLLMLFGVFVFIAPLANILLQQKANSWIAILTIFCSLGLFCAYHELSTHHFFLCIHAILYYLPVFIIGMYVARYQIWNIISKDLALFILFTALISLGIYVVFLASPSFYFDYFSRIVLGLAIVTMTLVILSHITIPYRFNLIINHFDRLSMGIYIIHAIIINAVLLIDGAKGFFNTHYQTGPFFLFAIGFCGAWGLSIILSRYKYLKWIIG